MVKTMNDFIEFIGDYFLLIFSIVFAVFTLYVLFVLYFPSNNDIEIIPKDERIIYEEFKVDLSNNEIEIINLYLISNGEMNFLESELIIYYTHENDNEIKHQVIKREDEKEIIVYLEKQILSIDYQRETFNFFKTILTGRNQQTGEN